MPGNNLMNLINLFRRRPYFYCFFLSTKDTPPGKVNKVHKVNSSGGEFSAGAFMMPHPTYSLTSACQSRSCTRRFFGISVFLEDRCPYHWQREAFEGEVGRVCYADCRTIGTAMNGEGGIR